MNNDQSEHDYDCYMCGKSVFCFHSSLKQIYDCGSQLCAKCGDLERGEENETYP